MPLNWWRRLKTGRSNDSIRARGGSRPAAPTFKPAVEALEDRLAPAVVFNPLQTNLSGLGSLNMAVVAVGDFYSTGNLDIVAVDNDNHVFTFQGNGDGTFKAPLSMAFPAGVTGNASTAPSGIAVGDFNNDGKTDVALAVPTQSAIFVLLGNGDGTFAGSKGAQGFAKSLNPIIVQFMGQLTNVVPTDIATADFDGDNKLDLAVACVDPGNGCPPNNPIPTHDEWFPAFGDGTGNFTGAPAPLMGGGMQFSTTRFILSTYCFPIVPPTNQPTPALGQLQYQPFQPSIPTVAIGNFDGITDGSGHGLAEVVATTPNAQPNIEIFFNGGLGNFSTQGAAAIPAPGGAFPVRTVSGDFNGDGKQDLAVLDAATGTVNIYLNPGSGKYLQAPTYVYQAVSGADNPQYLTLADVNGDSATDIIVTDTNANTLVLLLNRNDKTGQFLPPQTLNLPATGNAALFPVWIAVGDFNDDGKVDLVTANFNNGTVSTLSNQSTPYFYALGTGAGALGVVTVVDNVGAFQFNPFGTNQFFGGIRVAVGDVIGDNTPDLIVTTGAGGVTVVEIFDGASLETARGFVQPALAFFPFGLFSGGAYVAVGNLEGGGGLKLANGTSIRLKNAIVVGADAGGSPEVNVYTSKQILSGQSLNTPALAFFAYLPIFRGGVRVAMADVNGDKLADIITAAGPGGGPEVNVYYAAGSPKIISQQNVLGTGGVTPPDLAFFAFGPKIPFFGGIFVTAGDFDGDGLAEIVVGADSGGGPAVSIWGGRRLKSGNVGTGPDYSLFGIPVPSFTGGVRVGTTLGRQRGSNNKFGLNLLVIGGKGSAPITFEYDVYSILNGGAPTPFSTFSVPGAAYTNGSYVSGVSDH